MEFDYYILGGLALLIVGFVVWSRTRDRAKPDVFEGTPTGPSEPAFGGPFRDVRQQIEKLTKAQIVDKARTDFNVELNTALTKADLVTEYMKLYRQSKGAGS